MKRTRCLLLLVVSTCTLPARADDDGFVELFNGKDLTGWELGFCPPGAKPNDEKLDGKQASSDGTFLVMDGLIVATGKRLRGLYTAKEYNTDFHLRFEFRGDVSKKKNNSGVFIRGKQLQLDATNEGGLTGSFRNIKKFNEGDWNRIDIVVKGTEAACQCNDESIGKPMKLPEAGVLGLQSEFGKFEFRKVQVKLLK